MNYVILNNLYTLNGQYTFTDLTYDQNRTSGLNTFIFFAIFRSAKLVCVRWIVAC